MDPVSDQQTVLVVLIILAAFLAGLRASRLTARRKSGWRGRTEPVRTGASRSDRGVPDAAEQLRTVMSAAFQRQRLMSNDEARVFKTAEAVVQRLDLKWRVMAQVSLGEVLSTRDPAAYAAINSKRVDILLISGSGHPVAAVEYQGSGHYLGTAAARDAVKKEALRRAGVAWIEVTPGHDIADHLTREFTRISADKALGVAA